jgi:SAC3/GANP family
MPICELQIDEAGPRAFRTRATLVRTMDHLRCIMDRTDAPFALIHNFLFDRYRSVRQDLYVQGIEVRLAATLYWPNLLAASNY